MRHLRSLINLFRRNLGSDIEREVEFHIAERVDDLIASGASEGEAYYQARRQFGNRTGIEERTRDMNILMWLEEWFADFRFALRRLFKEPGFTLLALLSLGIGIGANTAVYTLINDVMMKPLPVADPQQLVSWGTADTAGVTDGIVGAIDLFPYDFTHELESNHDMFSDTAAYGSFPISVTARASGSAPAGRGMVELVSGTFFETLGVNPVLGRLLHSSDSPSPGGNAVAVLSFEYWQRQFSGARGVVGRPVIVNGSPYEVVGVAPADFFGVSLDVLPDLFIPVTMQPQVMLRPSFIGPNGLNWLHVISRLRPGVNIAQAREWTNLQLRRNLMARKGRSLSADPLKDIRESWVDLQPGGRGVTSLRAQYGEPLRILMGVTGVVLLIACANLASFSLARMASREKEIFARLALGAGRARIIRQVLTEGLLLSILGGALGLLFASWAARALIAFVIANTGRTPLDPAPDMRVLAFAFLAAILTGLLFSVMPAIRASQVDIASRLRLSSRSVAGNSSRPGRLPLSRILVAVQVALSLVLLCGAGLFVRTLQNLDRQGFGFNRSNALLVEFDPVVGGYKSDNVSLYYHRLLGRLEALPGVKTVSLSKMQPVSEGSWRSIIFTGLAPGVVSRAVRPGENIMSFINAVTPHYLDACGIPLLEGRMFEVRDSGQSEKVAVVSQTFVQHFFPDRAGAHAALGQLASIEGTPGQWRIVGVVADGHYNSARETPPPMIYVPLWQLSGDNVFASSLQLRTSGDPNRMIADVRRTFAEVDPNVAISRIDTFVHEVDTFLSQERLISRLSTFFSIGALLLASIGLYGVMSHSVARRTGEIGVRMALGAESSGIRAMILKESFTMLAAGIAVGVPASLLVARGVQSQLFGIRPFDPLTLGLAVLIIASVTLLAGWLPAWRAARVDPMSALRDD
jgi:predicted permease